MRDNGIARRCSRKSRGGVMLDKGQLKTSDHDKAEQDRVARVTANELRQFVERFERLEVEKKELSDQQKEVMAEAKARGYDTKVMKLIIRLRKRDADEIAEEEAVLELYKEALGMA